MTSSKPWYLSKGVIGALVTILLTVGQMAGLVSTNVDGAIIIEHVNELLTNLGVFAAGVLALYGRVVAKDKIGAQPTETPVG
jgi:hypothetical protein